MLDMHGSVRLPCISWLSFTVLLGTCISILVLPYVMLPSFTGKRKVEASWKPPTMAELVQPGEVMLDASQLHPGGL